MAWMTAEAAVAITAGVLASSIALTGFGLDSVIEFFAAAVVVWQLRGDGEERETRAVRLIGVTFFALALYLAVEGIRGLVTHARPGPSAAGLAVAAAALLVMPLLAVAKRRTGRALGNRTLVADFGPGCGECRHRRSVCVDGLAAIPPGRDRRRNWRPGTWSPAAAGIVRFVVGMAGRA